jgi:hypothetical protein
VSEPANRQHRAEARRNWPVRKYRLGEEPSEDLSSSTTAAERIGMMWRLAQDAWAMTGRPIPDYPREKTPITKRRLHDPPADGPEP